MAILHLNFKFNRTFFLLLSVFCLEQSWALCTVNLDLSCNESDNKFINRESQLKTNWEPKPVKTREKLLNSNEVQYNLDNCVQFTQLIKHECQIISPVQVVYIDEKHKIKNTFFVNKSRGDLNKIRNTLPDPFKKYFNYDSKMAAVEQNLAALATLGGQKSSRIESFLDSKNNNNILDVPYACKTRNIHEVCGIQIKCVAGKHADVGEKLRITKLGSMSPNAKKWCSTDQRLKRVLETVASFRDWNSKSPIKVVVEAEKTSNFKAFGKMPLMDQINSYSQGIGLDKYNKNLAVSGICMPTAHSMLAAGLKGEMPYNYLNNAFDSPNPVQVRDIKKYNTTQKQKLRYKQYAVHIDEMMRSAGLKKHFPVKFNHYSQAKIFHDVKSTERPPVTGENMGGWFVFFDKDYANTRKTQNLVEREHKNWIANKEAFVLGMQSSASQPNRYRKTVVGHAITTQGYSGENILINDPWNIMSHLRFADYKYPDAGKLITTVNDPTYNSCISAIPTNCKTHAERCVRVLNDFNLMHSKTRITIAINGCAYSGVPAVDHPTYTKMYNSCVSAARCRKTIDLKRPKKTYRMLAHVGAGEGYVGTASAEGHKTSAYITSYLKAAPWPAQMSTNTYRELHASDAVLNELEPSSQSCTAITEGTISVGEKSYNFLNPIPKFSTTPGLLASSTPIRVGCTDLHEIVDDGTATDIVSNLIGTFDVTCTNGVIAVTNNTCIEMEESKSCPMTHGMGRSFPVTDKLGQGTYYSGYGNCRVDICESGFMRGFNSCECKFIDSLGGPTLTGQVVEGRCEFQKSLCPAGQVFNAGSTLSAPSCVKPSDPIDVSSFHYTQYPALFIDANGKKLNEIYDINSKYAFNAAGFVEWTGCTHRGLVPSVNGAGNKVCTASPTDQLLKEAYIALSSGKVINSSPETCQSGFMFDYEGKFCVAKLSACNYGFGAYGMLTYDFEAPEGCRFMGCMEGYKVLQYSPREGMTSYFCSSNDKYSVSIGGDKILYSDPANGITEYEVPDFELRYMSDVPLSRADLDLIDHSRNYKTNLDCSLESDPELRAACRILAYSERDGEPLLPIVTPKINSWKMSEERILAAFNCGGPDTLASDGYCMSNWTQKRTLMGDCYIPNGIGYFRIGEGCRVASCLPGFATNPTQRACLRQNAPCYRSDLLNSANTFLAQTSFGPYGAMPHGSTESRCMIQSCKTGYQFVESFMPPVDANHFNGEFLYSDSCVAVAAVPSFSAQKVNKFSGAIPGSACAVPGGSGIRRLYSSGETAGVQCLVDRCDDGFAPFNNVCKVYKDANAAFHSNPYRLYTWERYITGGSTMRSPLTSNSCIAATNLSWSLGIYLGVNKCTSGPLTHNQFAYELKGNFNVNHAVGHGNFSSDSRPELDYCTGYLSHLNSARNDCLQGPIVQNDLYTHPLAIDCAVYGRNRLQANGNFYTEAVSLNNGVVLGDYDTDITSLPAVASYCNMRSNLTVNPSIAKLQTIFSPSPSPTPISHSGSGQGSASGSGSGTYRSPGSAAGTGSGTSNFGWGSASGFGSGTYNSAPGDTTPPEEDSTWESILEIFTGYGEGIGSASGGGSASGWGSASGGGTGSSQRY